MKMKKDYLSSIAIMSLLFLALTTSGCSDDNKEEMEAVNSTSEKIDIEVVNEGQISETEEINNQQLSDGVMEEVNIASEQTDAETNDAQTAEAEEINNQQLSDSEMEEVNTASEQTDVNSNDGYPTTEIEDVNNQLSENEMEVPTEESMREDCTIFSKEDGIDESELEDYMKSCIESLKQEYQNVQHETPTN